MEQPPDASEAAVLSLVTRNCRIEGRCPAGPIAESAAANNTAGPAAS